MYQINLSTLGIIFGMGFVAWVMAMVYYLIARRGGMARVIFCFGLLSLALGLGSLTLNKADWAKAGMLIVGATVVFITIATLALIRRVVFRRPHINQQVQILILFVLVLALLFVPVQTRDVADFVVQVVELLARATITMISGVGSELVKAPERYEGNADWSLVAIEFEEVDRCEVQAIESTNLREDPNADAEILNIATEEALLVANGWSADHAWIHTMKGWVRADLVTSAACLAKLPIEAAQ